MTTYTFDAFTIQEKYDPDTDGYYDSVFATTEVSFVSSGSNNSFSYELLESPSDEDSVEVDLYGLGQLYSISFSGTQTATGDIDYISADVGTVEWNGNSMTYLEFNYGYWDASEGAYIEYVAIINLSGDSLPNIYSSSSAEAFEESVTYWGYNPPSGFEEGDNISISSIGGSKTEVDNFKGSAQNDTVYLGNGADQYAGLAGNDTVFGGNGNDTAFGGNGADTLNGGTGADKLNGGNGNDTLNGASGNDTLNGGTGADKLNGGNDSDTLIGGDGNDILNGGLGDDKAFAGNGGDKVNGGGGKDTIKGGQGYDTLNGEAGNDNIDGGSGNDTISGGDGNDTLIGGDNNDTLTGNLSNDKLFGGAGADKLDGGRGVDTLNGGNGNDTLIGGGGNDTLIGGNGVDTFKGGGGADTFVFNGNANEARDTILDFGAADTIQISNTSLADVALTSSDGTAYITFDSGYEIIINGTTNLNVIEDNLVFV
jgi:Ca2+-binding RTX toxin-like protein